MQPYRQIRIHDPAACRSCGPMSPGHQVCQHDGCGELGEVQHRRHATAEEYAALPEGLVPIDGVCHMAVFTCGDHEVEPVCGPEDHPVPPEPEPPETVVCPRCDAQPGDGCVKANGNARRSPHRVRVPAPVEAPPVTACDHVHREDCEGLGACVCSASDPAPDRPRRVVEPVPDPGPAPMHVPTFGPIADYLAGYGIDVDRVVSLTPRPGADQTMVLHAVMVVKDPMGNWDFDDHGRPVTEEVEVPFAPTQPAADAPLGPVL